MRCLILLFICTALLMTACTERLPVDAPEEKPLACSSSLQGVTTAKTTLDARFDIAEVVVQADFPRGGCGGSFVAASYSGSSFQSSIGSSTIRLAHCVEQEPTFDRPGHHNIVNGWLEIAHTSGDRFLATYSGAYISANNDTLRGSFAVIEGTGRFAGAAGSGCFRAISSNSTKDEFSLQIAGKF